MMGGQVCNIREKSYEYGWLDKVTRILENGKEVARFEYHNNNRLAKVVRENGIETFEWDGLALIERNGTKYINEPHAGGGNPILAIGGDGQKTEAIFTDILGTSMGKVSGNGYSAIDKTSFGADTTDKSSFFTGKPYVEGLGYAFLLRNYRADIGKWLTQDLIGYPDGWNNFAYCGNMPESVCDIGGALWSWGTSAIGAAVSAAGYVATCWITGEAVTASGVAGAAAGGFVAGAIVGALVGDPSSVSVTTLIGAGALSSAAGQLTNNAVSTALDPNQDFNYLTLTDGVASSALIGGLTSGIASATNIDGILGEIFSLEIGIASGVYDYMKDSLIDSLERIEESKKQQLLELEAFYE